MDPSDILQTAMPSLQKFIDQSNNLQEQCNNDIVKNLLENNQYQLDNLQNS